MSIEVRVLRSGEEAVLANVAEDVFDDPIDAQAARVFLADRRHHIAVALDGDLVIGFASGVHYIHPDKTAPELFINEVGVASSHRGRGIAKAIMHALLQAGRNAGCRGAWVLTDRDNHAAMRLYAATGGEAGPNDHVMFSFALPPVVPAPSGSVLSGHVQSGRGDAAFWLAKLRDHYRQKTGMDLFPGTLNVQLAEPYRVPPGCTRLEAHQWGGTVSVSIVPCRVFGHKAFILRTDGNDRGTGDHPLTIVEIATDVNLRDAHGLADGDPVDIELTPETP